MAVDPTKQAEIPETGWNLPLPYRLSPCTPRQRGTEKTRLLETTRRRYRSNSQIDCAHQLKTAAPCTMCRASSTDLKACDRARSSPIYRAHGSFPREGRAPMIAIRTFVLSAALADVRLPVRAEEPAPVNPQIDYAGFVELADKVGEYREQRRLAWDEFAARAGANGAILLDARSESGLFAQGHIAGAINLPLPDFTAERLAEVLGSDRAWPVHIYCNNNFADNRVPVVTKTGRAGTQHPDLHQPRRLRLCERLGARRGHHAPTAPA